jgi:hypothetical protein
MSSVAKSVFKNTKTKCVQTEEHQQQNNVLGSMISVRGVMSEKHALIFAVVAVGNIFINVMEKCLYLDI